MSLKHVECVREDKHKRWRLQFKIGADSFFLYLCDWDEIDAVSRKAVLFAADLIEAQHQEPERYEK